MRRFLLLLTLLVTIPLGAHANDAPPGQIPVSVDNVLRGHFVEERNIKGFDGPMRSTGAFVLAPGHGLLWQIKKPIPLSTIITPNGMVQDIGGVALKLPAKNLHHIYDMVGAALAGDWSAVESDFVLTQSGNAEHWQILLTPKKENTKLPYSLITVSGSRFVESIVMVKGDSNDETLSFSDEALSQAPPTPTEIATFEESTR
jgi:hypothetical protein